MNREEAIDFVTRMCKPSAEMVETVKVALVDWLDTCLEQNARQVTPFMFSVVFKMDGTYAENADLLATNFDTVDQKRQVFRGIAKRLQDDEELPVVIGLATESWSIRRPIGSALPIERPADAADRKETVLWQISSLDQTIQKMGAADLYRDDQGRVASFGEWSEHDNVYNGLLKFFFDEFAQLYMRRRAAKVN